MMDHLTIGIEWNHNQFFRTISRDPRKISQFLNIPIVINNCIIFCIIVSKDKIRIRISWKILNLLVIVICIRSGIIWKIHIVMLLKWNRNFDWSCLKIIAIYEIDLYMTFHSAFCSFVIQKRFFDRTLTKSVLSPIIRRLV